MSIQERVQEIFNRFNVNLTVTEETKEEFAEATLDNGTTIYTDAEDFNEGVEAYIINDEGERIPVPPGDYTFKDGSVLSVGDGGKVTAISKKGDGKDGKTPAKKGEAPAAKDAPASDAPADGGDSEPAPVKDPVKKVTKSSDFAEEEEVEEIAVEEEMPITREEIAEMIRSIVTEMMGDEEKYEEDEEKEMEEEEKEEMSAVNPEAPKGIDEVVEEKPRRKSKKEEVVEDPTEDAVMTELAQVKEQLFELQKKAAAHGLKRRTPSPKKEALNLSEITSTEERVRALIKHYNA